MNKTNKYKLLYDITLQLAGIYVLFLVLFIEARFSYYFNDTWSDYVRDFVVRANIINIIVMIVLIALTVFFGIKSGISLRKHMTMDTLEAAAYIAALFAFHIIVRLPMLGTYQLSDGTTYLNFMNSRLAAPDALLKDFLHNSTIAGHLAQGFVFTTALGQLLNTVKGMGFQYSQMIFGSFCAVFLFGIVKKVMPREKNFKVFMISLITSVQPMFLGLSTFLQMEYMLTVLFIFSIYFLLYRKNILAFFWLLCLGTCKETGLMMALSLVFFFLISELAGYVKKKGSLRDTLKKIKKIYYVLFLAIFAGLVFAIVKVINYPLWGGYRIIDVLKVGGDGNMNFQFNAGHLLMKIRQLYILNFSWICVIIILLYIVLMAAVPSVRKNKAINVGPFAHIIIQYGVYTLFLLLFQEAKMTRYNMLSDTLLLLVAMILLARMISFFRLYVLVSAVIAVAMFTEVFLTVDPVTRAVFTKVDCGKGVSMVWTARTKSEYAQMQNNIGDFGYYNYQYTYIDRCVDIMLGEVDYQSWYKMLAAASNNIVEDQIFNQRLWWDSRLKTRRYNGDGYDHIFPVEYVKLENEFKKRFDPEESNDVRLIMLMSPWCEYDMLNIYRKMAGIYDFEGPYNISVGVAGSIDYYILYIK